MSQPQTSIQPTRVALRDLLALREGRDRAEWGRIRAAQLAAGRRLAPFMFAANMAGAAMIVLLLDHRITIPVLGAWIAAIAAVSGFSAYQRLRSHHRDDGYAGLGDIRRTALEGLAMASVWAIVPLFFCHIAEPSCAGSAIVLGLIITAAAFLLAPVLPGVLGFVLGLGAIGTADLALEGHFYGAAGVLLYALLLAAIAIGRANTMVALRAAEIALEERDETVSLLLREFEDAGADWLWETDASRRIIKASPRFAVACGLDPVSINGMPFLQVLAGPSWETGNFAPGLRQLSEKLKARQSFRDLRLPVEVRGQSRWWELAASPRFDDRGAFCGFRGVGSDVTEQRDAADKINRMARSDTLTGLPNRLAINETLVRAMVDAEKWRGRCAFMMIDLDRFKAVNDTLGHPVGDRLLGRVAERLSQLMDDNAMCGRLGGDEFAVVVRDAQDLKQVEHLARRIIETLSRAYDMDQHTLHIGASVGLAIGPRDGKTAEDLIRSADLALYQSKDAGGGAFHIYEPGLHARAEERRVLEQALRKALDRGELHLAYQPVVDAQSELLTGFEALLRWNSAEFGAVSPAKFIPLAEDARLIGPIGDWVLRAACHEAACWPGFLRVAVNVSPEQLNNPQFVDTVVAALESSGLAPERLELEVTESVFMQEALGATRVLERILALGIRLSLDDFGTGYSSLGYLSRTRFSTIKIDRSFVQGAAKGVAEATAIIRAVVALARSLDMTTTAEGVETESEHQLVRDFGCSKIQGYYFSRPVLVEEARALAERRHRQAA